MFGFESFDMVAANRLHGGYSANSLEQLLINYTNEVLQASVGVAGSGLDPLHRQTQGSGIGQRLLVSGRGGPFGLGKLGVTVHAQRGLRESLLKRNRLSNWMA